MRLQQVAFQPIVSSNVSCPISSPTQPFPNVPQSMGVTMKIELLESNTLTGDTGNIVTGTGDCEAALFN